MGCGGYLTVEMLGAIILAHLVGDYLLQSHWIATEKTKRWWPAILHGVLYTVPYAFVTQSLAALAVIGGTHILIDRYRLARHISWVKNLIAPKRHWPARTATGYPDDTPPWLSVWLLFIVDNTMHLLINTAAIAWL